MDLTKHYVNGEWATPLGDQTFPVLNPATEAQVETIVLGNAADVDRAVAAAKIAFESYSQTSKSERLDLLRELLVQTKARIEDLAVAISTEMGAPISMSRAEQADTAVGHLEAFIEALEGQEEQTTLANGDIMLREPIGVCGLITPWNWPMNQFTLKVIPVLATGCTCVIKPSEHTPISAAIYAEIVEAAGFPPGVFNLVQGDGLTVGAAMSRHPDIQMMSFTGSTGAGKAISRDAADTVKRVSLELGGNPPMSFLQIAI